MNGTCIKKQSVPYRMLSSHKDTLQWCSKAIQIRTVFVADSYLQLREGDGFRAFLVVEGDHHFIIVQKNRVSEGCLLRPFVWEYKRGVNKIPA